MQLPPGRSLLDWRCVKDTPPAALEHGEVDSRVLLVSLVLQRFICTGARTDGGAALAQACMAVSAKSGYAMFHAVVLRLPFVHDSCPCWCWFYRTS